MNADQQEQEHMSGMTMFPPDGGLDQRGDLQVQESMSSSYQTRHIISTHDSVSPTSTSLSPISTSLSPTSTSLNPSRNREQVSSTHRAMNSTSVILGSTDEPLSSTTYIPVVSTSQFVNSTHQPLNSTPQLESTTHQTVNFNHNQSSSTSQSISSTPQYLSPTHQYLSSTYQPLSSTHQTKSSTNQILSSTLQYLNSTHQPLSSTPQPLSSTPQPLSSTPQPLSSTPQPLSSNPQPLSSTPHTLHLTIPAINATIRTSRPHRELIKPDSNYLTSTPEWLSSSHKAVGSTNQTLSSTSDKLNPASHSLLSSLQLVSTTQVPSLRTLHPSSHDTIRLSLNASESIQKPHNLEREPQESYINLSTTTDSPPPTSKRRHHQTKPTAPSSDQLPSTTTTLHRSIHKTKNVTPKRRSAKNQENVVTIQASSAARVAGPGEDVCRSDPCGDGVSCHPKSTDPFYDCICPDGTVLSNGTDACKDIHLEVVPEPKSVLPTEVNKPNNVVGVAVVASVVLMVVLLVVYWRRKTLYTLLKLRQREKKPGPKSPGALAKSTSLLTYNFASNPNYYSQSPDALPLHTLAVHLIDAQQIAFVGELGEGCFGKVYKGTYGPRCPENLGENVDTVSLTVAVKVLKESAGVEAEADFLREVEIMSTFRHENILSLIGIVVTETVGTPWMVFEYMAYGDLAEVLRSCNKQFYSNDSPIKSLSKEDLLNMSVQIASGMEYLSSQHFVHRDLACRNCLVGETLAVKISDFGMSRDVYTCDYYKVGGSRMLPVRWMAHESIMYGKFTLESDVWSFGVVLWEIYSFGKQPYYGNSNENVVKLIFQGILLSPPDTCPPQVCDVMRRCWATDPNDRLKFPEILTRLQRLQECQKGTVAPPVTPSNIPGVSAPITYSELCLHDEGGFELDSDQYLMPRKAEHREYITVFNDV